MVRGTCANRLLSSEQYSGNHSALHAILNLSTGCKFPGCTRARYCEPYGFIHEFCGKTHATAYSRMMSVKKSSDYQSSCK